jgi:hypothetical protein
MIDSPLIVELISKRIHRLILGILEDRFGAVPADIVRAIETVTDDERLQALNTLAARCPDLEAFRAQVAS